MPRNRAAMVSATLLVGWTAAWALDREQRLRRRS